MSSARSLDRACCGLLLLLAAAAATASAQDAQTRRGFSIRITEPQNQQVVLGRTKIAAEVEVRSKSMVDRVEFMVGDDVIFVDREPPFECVHNFGEASRSWIVRAVAYHVEEVAVSDAIITRKLRFGAVERVNRVILWISAMDKSDNYITDLSREDFQILEDGTPQKVIDFYREDRPITIAILLDTSTSMEGRLAEVQKAAGSFVETLRAEDSAMVIDFDDKVFLIQDLTSSQGELKEAITSTSPFGGTAIYDALHAAYRKMEKIQGRRAVILLSDGSDSASQFSFKRVSEEARAKNIMIYSIALGGGPGALPRKKVLEEFSDVTGGRFFFAKTAEELSAIYQRIAEELRRQYYLTYSTSIDEWDGRWITVKVESLRRGIDVRARRGYFAVRRPFE